MRKHRRGTGARGAGAGAKKIAAVLLIFAAAAGFLRGLPKITAFAAPAARLSAFLAMPDRTGASSSGASSEDAESETPAPEPENPETEPESPAASNAAASSAPKPINPEDIAGKVIETRYTAESANLTWGSLAVNNRTKSHTVDIEAELAEPLDLHPALDGQPEVLIYHTHATEAFVEGDTGYYTKDHQARSTDTEQNVVRVGDEIARILEEKGIGVLHDRTLHDEASYNAAYDNSEAAVKAYMERYPTLKVFLDIHRDAISQSDGSKLKPTVTVGGRKAAQLMIAVGCEDNGVTGFPNWRQNLRFALRLQQALEASYPGLARPIYFVSKKYNEFLANGSLLIEMGSEGNTLEEAVYAGGLLADALSQVLKNLKQ